MILNLEQLRSAAMGAVSVEQHCDGVVFHRFTQEQLALYQYPALEYQTKFYEKALFPAGVKLSFLTDSTGLYLRVLTRKTIGVRRFFSVDITVDGKFLESLDNFSHKLVPDDYINEPYCLGTFEKEFSLGPGQKHVCVYLPWCAMFWLQELRLDDGANFAPVKPNGKLLVYGDSITQGYDVLHPSKRPAALLAQMLGLEEVNKAIGGERFFPALARLKDGFTPEYIYVAYGTNDWGSGEKEAFLKNSKAFFAALRDNYPDTPILAVTPIWRKNHLMDKAFGPFTTVEQGIRDAVASLENVFVIRGFAFVPGEERYFSDRSLHPNNQGFAHYAQNLCAAVREVLGL